MSEKLTIKPINLGKQKPTDVKECYLELLDNHLRFVLKFNADEPIIEDDEMSGTKSVMTSFDIIAMKKHVAGTEKSYTKGGNWLVIILVNGFDNEIKIYSRTETMAQQFFDKINTWLLTV